MFTFYLDKFPKKYKYAVRIINKKANEELSCAFDTYLDAGMYESMLDFIGAEYETYSREEDENYWKRIR